MARVLILGGGFGGVSAAHHLRELAPEHEVTLVDRGTHFMMGFRKNDEVVGRAPMDEGRRPLAALADRGVEVIQGTITRIDPGARAAEVDGRTLEADALVVALGAEHAPEAVPGLAERGMNPYDPAEVPRVAEALGSLDRGQVVIGIFGVPYTCPPAPYELALLALEAAEARGADLRFSVFTPQPMSLPVLGRAGCEVIEGRLRIHGIGFTPLATAERVEPGRVVLEGGGEIPFDLLLGIPPHRPPAVVRAAGLAQDGGWIPVDPPTLQTSFDRVWAVGDATGIPLATGMPLPKAGVLAEAEGRVVAERVAATLAGQEPEAVFDGQGSCYLEVGGGQAMQVTGRFLAEPAPEVELLGPSEELLMQKASFERERLDAWFNSP
jgi:sulfide:quinone oxidoreductase